MNGNQIIKVISDAPPQSFLLRWMTNDEIERIEREQDNAEFYTIFGSDAMLVKLFGACAKGFSSRKLHDTSRIPVMRLGRSGDACLYLIGNECTTKNASAAHRHSALFIDGNVAVACTSVIDIHSCASLHIITDHTDEVHFKECTIPVTFSLTPDFSWQSLTALLTNAISTVMNRE